MVLFLYQAAAATISLRLLGFGRAAQVFAGTTTAFRYSVAELLKETGEFERTLLRLQVILGDDQAGSAMLKTLRTYAQITPFFQEEVTQAGTALLAYGFHASELSDTINMLGDIAIGTGIDLMRLTEIYGKASVQTKVYARDIQRLTRAGVPVIEYLLKTNMELKNSARELFHVAAQGRLTSTDIKNALEKMVEPGERFHDATKRASEDFKGISTTIIDQIGILSTSFGKWLIDADFSTIGFGLRAVNKGLEMIGMRSDSLDRFISKWKISISSVMQVTRTGLNELIDYLGLLKQTPAEIAAERRAANDLAAAERASQIEERLIAMMPQYNDLLKKRSTLLAIARRELFELHQGRVEFQGRDIELLWDRLEEKMTGFHSAVKKAKDEMRLLKGEIDAAGLEAEQFEEAGIFHKEARGYAEMLRQIERFKQAQEKQKAADEEIKRLRTPEETLRAEIERLSGLPLTEEMNARGLAMARLQFVNTLGAGRTGGGFTSGIGFSQELQSAVLKPNLQDLQKRANDILESMEASMTNIDQTLTKSGVKIQNGQLVGVAGN
jgi:hypothetical protein